MNPQTTKKDSDSLVTSNPFDEFNNGLTGKPATPGKKDSQTMGKTVAPQGNAFDQFNENLKKKDSPGVSGDGSAPVSNSGNSTGASTSSSNGETVDAIGAAITAVGGVANVAKNLLPRDQRATASTNPESIVTQLKKNLEDSQSFIQTDINSQPVLSPYPAVMGRDGKPLPDNWQPGYEDPNSGKMPEKFKIMITPEKTSEYVNRRVASIENTIKSLKEQREKFVTYEQKQVTPKVTQTIRRVTDQGQYNAVSGQITQQEEYLKKLQQSAIEVIGNNLVKRELAKPGMIGDYVIKGPRASVGIPRDLGRDIIRFADKKTNDQYTALEEKNMPLGGVPNADMERLGLETWKKYILLHDDIPNRESLIKDIQQWEEDFDTNNFELTAARVRHKIGADLKAHSGFGSSIYRPEPNLFEIVMSAKRAGLTPSEMKVFESYVLPVERRNWGTDIPMSGFVNKFGEAINTNVLGLTNIFRSDTERLSEALNQELDTRFDEVGEFSRDKQELHQLQAKEKTKEGITATEKTRKQELEKYVDVRKWYDKFWDGAGDLTGQVAYQAGLARLFGGLGSLTSKAPVVGGLISKGTTFVGGPDAINLMMTSFITSYDNHAKEAVLLMPRKDQALERRMYAYTMSAVEGLSERIFPDTKVLDAFRRTLRPEVAALTSRLAAREISQEAARSRLQNLIANKLKPFAKSFVKAEVQESTEEAVVDIAQGISDTIFAGKDFDAQETFGNAADTFLTTMAYSPFVSGMAAVKDVRTAALGKSGLYKMAVDPETYRREVYRQVEEGSLSQAEGDKKLQIINTAAEIQKQLPVKKSLDPKQNPELAELNSKWKENIRAIGERTDIDETEKEKLKSAEDERSGKEIADYMKEIGKNNDNAMDYADRVSYLTHRLNETLLEKQINDTKDEVVKADLQKQLDRSKKIREGIFNGSIIVGNNLDELTADQKTADELGITSLAEADEDTLPINISKPKIEEDEKVNDANQQIGKESGSGENIGTEESSGEQSLQEKQTEVVTGPGAAEEGTTSLPAATPYQGKEKIKGQIDKLADDNYLFSHVTTEANAKSITEGGMNISPGTGVSSTLTQVGKESANSQIERLINGEVVHRDNTNNSVAIISVPKAELDKMTGKDISEKLENYLAENNMINDKGQYAIPTQFNAGYLSGDTFISTEKPAAAAPTLPSGMSQEQFNKLPEKIKEKLLAQQNKPVKPATPAPAQPAAQDFTNEEQDAINSLNQKDLTGTGLAPYASVLNNPEATAEEKKAALRGISDQLTDVNSAERVGSELGRDLSEKVYGLGYPEVGNTQFDSRANETEKKNKFAEVDGKVVPVTYQPLENISTDVKRFQPRGSDFSQESVDKIVNDYDDNKLDPVVLFKDKDGKDYVLAGHSRLEAHNQLSALPDTDPRKIKAVEKGFQPGEIKSRYFNGTEKEAMEFADRSNDLGTKNKDYESAASLRKMREAGDTKTAIKDRARTDFGKNWRYLYNLSFLNPNGKIIQTLQQFESNPDKDAQNQIEKAGQWIGATRERFGDMLSNQHENEMFDYLMDKGRSTKIQRENDFVNLIQNITGSAFYDPNEPLNLNRIKNKSAAEVNYDTEEADIKASIKEREKELSDLSDRLNNPQNPAYVNPNSSDYSEVLRNAEKKKQAINTELTALRKELLEHQQEKGKVISSGLAQPGLFDMANLTPEETTQLNDELVPNGITVENIQSYEQDNADPETVSEADTSIEGQTQTIPQDVRQPVNDQGASTQQDQGSTTVSGQERASSTVDPVEQEKRAKLEEAKKAFKDSLRKSRGNLNAGVPLNPEVIANGVKLMAAYADLGLYKFKQIVQDIADTIGADFLDNENVSALKGVYSYYRSNQPRDQRGEFDTEDQVDDFIENDLQAYTSPVDNLTEEQHLIRALEEAQREGDADDVEFRQEELNTYRNNPFQYWSDLYHAYSPQDYTEERSQEAYENIIKLAQPGTYYTPKNTTKRAKPETVRLKEFVPNRIAILETKDGNERTITDNAFTSFWKQQTDQTQINDFNNGTGTAKNLATDSTRATSTNELGESELLPAGTRDISETESGEPAIISTIQPAGSPGLLPLDAVTGGTYSDSQLPIGEQLAGLETGIAGDRDSGGSDTVDETGIPSERGTSQSVEGAANQITGQSISEKIELQKAAESLPVKDMDLDNIRATLPFLMKEQQEDVYKAENRFFGENNDPNKLYGKGMLFTNGTGTGKTLTGLGIIKRMIKRGKGNGIIVVPSDPKVKDWMAEGKDYMGIDIHQLTGKLDGGNAGPNITTYANFRDNPNLRLKTWDWVVYDESHKINSNGQGGDTAGENAHKHITSSPRVARIKARQTLNYDSKITDLGLRRVKASDENDNAELARISQEGKLLDEQLKAETIKEFQKTKVVFLSATPFSYHPNLTYADGYLFQINEEFEPQYGTNSYNNFYISNFGYRIRYNKLTKPESGVDVDLLERQFTENLKKQGVVVSRKLNVDKDYSRQFAIVDDELGTKIDEGLNIATNRDEFPDLWDVVQKRMAFQYKNQLMEAIKAKWAVDRIKQHLALGRKVVVSHSYNHSEPAHPFDWDGLLNINDEGYAKKREQIKRFHDTYPEYRALDLRGLTNPLETLSKAFGKKVVFFNGEVSKKERTENKKLFNDDNSGVDILVVQMDAGKEGISLHDKTGKHQRALINLGLPYKPTDAIQIEGRIYRTGQKSDAVIEYPILNLAFERMAYANKINERVRTAENFALGEEARNMETAFKEGYLNGTNEQPSLEQGKGGKEEDARTDSTTEYQKTLTYYYKRGKRTAAQKRNVEGDYYATPEPLGYKMAEWMDLVPNEKALEPSSGHGAIARFFPRTTKNIFIEPNTELRSETAMNGFGETKAGTFEDLNIINKFDGIAMNPPFGRGGKLAMEHLEKALGHLHDGGRAVALVPTGQMNDRLANWLDSDKSKGFYITAKIQLPQVVFERAGTQVSTQIIVIDKVLDEEKAKQLPQQRNIDLTGYNNIKEFFDAIEDLSLPQRIDAGKYAEEAVPNDVQEIAPTATDNATSEPAPVNDLAEVIKNFHEKAQRDNWVVKLKKQVSPDEFKTLSVMAKDMGGYYSRFKGSGAVPGFQFDNEAAANNMVSAIAGKNVPEAEKMSLADRIRTWKIAQNGRNLYSTIIPGGPQLWNAAVEIVAKAVQAGTALIDALNAGREHIEKNWKKSWQKAKYNGEMISELKGRGVLSYNLSPTQIAEADASIARVARNGKLIQEINDLREAFDYAKAALTDPADIADLEDSYNEFERYIFDGLAAQEIDKLENFSLGLEGQTWWQKQKENWQNRYQRMEQVQKEIEAAGLTIEEKNDMVNRADRWKSIAAAKIDNILREVGLADVDVFVWKGRKKLDNSLFDQMAKDGVDYRKFNLYMYARHAPERNAHNAKLRREAFAKKMAQLQIDLQKYNDNYIANPNPTTKGLITKKENEIKAYEEYEAEYNDPTGNKNYLKLLEKKIDRRSLLMDDGGSGMTNAQAQEIIDEVKAEGNDAKFEQYEKLISDKIIKQSLDLQKEYGLIDDENYEYMKNYYQNYVPLKVDDSYFEKNQTFSDSGIPGAKIYASKGANYHTFESRVNPITQAIIDLQATIYEGEQNKYKQTVAETIKTAPDKDIWELKSALYAPIKDKTGKIVGLDEINVPPNGLPYFDNGQKKYLVINDKALHEAMTGANVKSAIPILSKINGFFRSLYTVYNPVFTVTNLFRDMETAGIVMSATQKGDVSTNFRGNVRRIFSILKGAYQAQGGADKTYWQQRAKEYKDAGGNMSWFQQEPAEDQVRDIEAAYQKYQKDGLFDSGKNMALKVADFVNKVNNSVENSTRLAMYDAMLKAGVPQYKAVEVARNATINFQKKGNYGSMVDSLYLFYNASVQGTANVMKTLLTTRAGLKMAGGIVLAGALLNVYNNLMSDCGPEADPANCYDNIPDYEKERNMIIKIPGGRGFLKIPLAWGFNVFFNGGDQISQMIHGKTNWQQATSFLAKSAFNSFNPTGSVDQPVLQHISPTATDPVVQWFTNRDAFGRPIYNDFEYDRRPDSQRGFASDSKNAKELAAWLNKQTGGNEKVKGKVDVSPGTLDWLYETFTGGTGQFMSQTIGSTRDAFDPKEDVQIKEIPIINRFYTAPRERSNRQYIFEQLDDSYNTIMSQKDLQGFNTELDKAIRLGEIKPDKADKYRRTVIKNQYELTNQDLFSVIDRSKQGKLTQDEIDNFVGELNRRAEGGEIPKEWIRSYKAEITKNQKPFKTE